MRVCQSCALLLFFLLLGDCARRRFSVFVCCLFAIVVLQGRNDVGHDVEQLLGNCDVLRYAWGPFCPTSIPNGVAHQAVDEPGSYLELLERHPGQAGKLGRLL